MEGIEEAIINLKNEIYRELGEDALLKIGLTWNGYKRLETKWRINLGPFHPMRTLSYKAEMKCQFYGVTIKPTNKDDF